MVREVWVCVIHLPHPGLSVSVVNLKVTSWYGKVDQVLPLPTTAFTWFVISGTGLMTSTSKDACALMIAASCSGGTKLSCLKFRMHFETSHTQQVKSGKGVPVLSYFVGSDVSYPGVLVECGQRWSRRAGGFLTRGRLGVRHPGPYATCRSCEVRRRWIRLLWSSMGHGVCSLVTSILSGVRRCIDHHSSAQFVTRCVPNPVTGYLAYRHSAEINWSSLRQSDFWFPYTFGNCPIYRLSVA